MENNVNKKLEQIVEHIGKEIDNELPAHPAIPPSDGLIDKVKEWYARRGPRFKYNAEMIFAALAEMPGGLLGSITGGYLGVKLSSFDEYIPRAVNTFAGEIETPTMVITICTLLGSATAYWGSWWAIRRADQRHVYDKYPEIKYQDIVRFVGASLLLSGAMTIVRGGLTYLFNKWGFGELSSAAMAILPTQIAGIGIMNIYGSYAGLVRDERKLKETISNIKERREELQVLDAPKNTPGNPTSG